jgi:hypothetical protein
VSDGYAVSTGGGLQPGSNPTFAVAADDAVFVSRIGPADPFTNDPTQAPADTDVVTETFDFSWAVFVPIATTAADFSPGFTYTGGTYYSYLRLAPS